jgi:hypothetical protein
MAYQGTTPDSSLKLTTSIVEQSYDCNGDLRLSLKFQYANIGTESIILRRYNFRFPRYTISRNAGAAAKGHYEREVNSFVSTVLAQPNPTRGPEPWGDRFVILKPGENYGIETRPDGADLVIRNPSDQRLGKGDHVLQISVSTWNEPVALAQELGDSWRKYGILWWQGVTSEPMPLKIEKPSTAIKCS